MPLSTAAGVYEPELLAFQQRQCDTLPDTNAHAYAGRNLPSYMGDVLQPHAGPSTGASHRNLDFSFNQQSIAEPPRQLQQYLPAAGQFHAEPQQQSQHQQQQQQQSGSSQPSMRFEKSYQHHTYPQMPAPVLQGMHSYSMPAAMQQPSGSNVAPAVAPGWQGPQDMYSVQQGFEQMEWQRQVPPLAAATTAATGSAVLASLPGAKQRLFQDPFTVSSNEDTSLKELSPRAGPAPGQQPAALAVADEQPAVAQQRPADNPSSIGPAVVPTAEEATSALGLQSLASASVSAAQALSSTTTDVKEHTQLSSLSLSALPQPGSSPVDAPDEAITLHQVAQVNISTPEHKDAADGRRLVVAGGLQLDVTRAQLPAAPEPISSSHAAEASGDQTAQQLEDVLLQAGDVDAQDMQNAHGYPHLAEGSGQQPNTAEQETGQDANLDEGYDSNDDDDVSLSSLEGMAALGVPGQQADSGDAGSATGSAASLYELSGSLEVAGAPHDQDGDGDGGSEGAHASQEAAEGISATRGQRRGGHSGGDSESDAYETDNDLHLQSIMLPPEENSFSSEGSSVF